VRCAPPTPGSLGKKYLKKEGVGMNSDTQREKIWEGGGGCKGVLRPASEVGTSFTKRTILENSGEEYSREGDHLVADQKQELDRGSCRAGGGEKKASVMSKSKAARVP